MQYGQLAAGTALISGTKNEEMSAAYLLMQLYPVPAKRWDEERSWVYLGVAIRCGAFSFELMSLVTIQIQGCTRYQLEPPGLHETP